jgi:Fur family ferric uptake transcriptional regulator
MEKTIQALGLKIKKGGYRLTAARRAILEALVTGAGHMSANEVASIARQRSPRVGRMTVYRTLELLSRLGLVRPMHHQTGATRYVLLADGRHHHMICSSCDSVFELDRCLVEEMEQELGKRHGFAVQGHVLELFGLCDSCQEREL